jgi:hypothetical protein
VGDLLAAAGGERDGRAEHHQRGDADAGLARRVAYLGLLHQSVQMFLGWETAHPMPVKSHGASSAG